MLKLGSMVALSLGLLAMPAAGQGTGSNVLQLVVGYPAGGGLDTATRQLAESLRQVANRPVIVENKPGAASLIAAEAVASAKPDGTILLVAPMTVTAVHPFIFKNLRFDPNADLVPVIEFGVFRYGLAVNVNVPARTVREFVEWSKKNSGKVSFATLGTGSFAQLLGLVFNDAAGADMVEVPYKGSAPGLTDLRAGHVQATFDTNSSLVEHHRSGAIRILAVSGRQRSPLLPDVATFAESQLNLGELRDAEFWYGIFAPKSTPKPVVDSLNKIIGQALASADLIARLAPLDIVPNPRSADEFAKIVAADTRRWGSIVRAHANKIERQ